MESNPRDYSSVNPACSGLILGACLTQSTSLFCLAEGKIRSHVPVARTKLSLMNVAETDHSKTAEPDVALDKTLRQREEA